MKRHCVPLLTQAVLLEFLLNWFILLFAFIFGHTSYTKFCCHYSLSKLQKKRIKCPWVGKFSVFLLFWNGNHGKKIPTHPTTHTHQPTPPPHTRTHTRVTGLQVTRLYFSIPTYTRILFNCSTIQLLNFFTCFVYTNIFHL